MDLILHFLLLGIVIFMLARIHPGIHIEGLGTAITVAIVYGLINVFLGTILKFLAFPIILLTLFLFTLVINTFLLWLTDKLIEDFEIENMGTTFVAAVVITIADTLLGWIF